MAANPTPPREPLVPDRLTEADGPPDNESSLENRAFGALGLVARSLELVDLTGCQLAGTRLSGSTWRRCTLRHCRLTGCDLANATLDQTALRQVEVTESRLTGFAIGRAPHRDVGFAGCQAELSVWRSARLERAALRDCRLTRSDWGGATLTDVVFEGCDLSGADFSQCRMKAVRFAGCRYDGIRGLDGLRGASVQVDDLLGLQLAMAAELGIVVHAGR